MSRNIISFTQEELLYAFSAIRQKKIKIRKAAREFQVPTFILHGRLTEKLKYVKPGQTPMWTVEE